MKPGFISVPRRPSTIPRVFRGESASGKAKATLSARKVRATVFWGVSGTINHAVKGKRLHLAKRNIPFH